MLRRLLCGKTVKIQLQFRPETTFDKVNSMLMYAVCGDIRRRRNNGEDWYEMYVYPFHMRTLFNEAKMYNTIVIVED